MSFKSSNFVIQNSNMTNLTITKECTCIVQSRASGERESESRNTQKEVKKVYTKNFMICVHIYGGAHVEKSIIKRAFNTHRVCTAVWFAGCCCCCCSSRELSMFNPCSASVHAFHCLTPIQLLFLLLFSDWNVLYVLFLPVPLVILCFHHSPDSLQISRCLISFSSLFSNHSVLVITSRIKTIKKKTTVHQNPKRMGDF